MEFSWRLHVHNFEKNEWKNEPDRVLPELVLTVDALTAHMKMLYPQTFCNIHVAYESSEHREDSKHYEGRAVDLHFQGIPLFFQFTIANQFKFTGIGVYPHWRNPGLHLEIEADYKANRTKRWWRDSQGEYRPIHELAFYEAIKL